MLIRYPLYPLGSLSERFGLAAVISHVLAAAIEESDDYDL